MATQRLSTGRSSQFADSVSAGAFAEDQFTAAALQTVFVTSFAYLAGGLSALFVNGVEYDIGVDYTLVGTTLTWLDTLFTLGVGDKVTIKYQR